MNSNSNSIINHNIYTFLYSILNNIFLAKDSDNSKEIESHINKWINKINKEIIKDKMKYINIEYTSSNFKNIINFVKSQNTKYAGDILEGILIKIFSSIIKIRKDETIEKIIFNNLSNSKNIDIYNWFQIEKFKPKEMQNLSTLLNIEASKNPYNLIRNYPIINLLYEIIKLKYIDFDNINNNSKTDKLINKGEFKSHETMKKIFNSVDLNQNKIIDIDFKYNSISTLISFIEFEEFLENKKFPIPLLRCFLLSVFIYYQNEKSFLMKFDKNINNDNEKLSNIPFVYNLSDAVIEGKYASTILSPSKLSNFSSIILTKNNLRELGLLELSKNILFNKDLKNINLKQCLLKSNYLDFFNFGLGIFDNYTVETLDLSLNYLNEESEDFLSKILSHLKGLKTINLTNNNLKNGLSRFFIVLKNLYRKKQIELENLILNKCSLNDMSFYELGELVKCKYCKIKKLYLSDNLIPINVQFLKKLKLNKSINEIHINKSNIYNKNIKDIEKLISNTNIKIIYLYKNKIHDFDQVLYLININKFIKQEKENFSFIDNSSFTIHLDLSNNDIYFKNSNHINLLNKSIEQMNLFCLDLSHILLGNNPEKYYINPNNQNYKNQVDKLKNNLEKYKNLYYDVKKNLRYYEVDVERYKYLENDELLKELDINEITNIINNNNSKYPVFLKQKAKEILINLQNEKNKFKDNNKDIYENKIFNYFILKRAENNLIQLNKKRIEEKLIII